MKAQTEQRELLLEATDLVRTFGSQGSSFGRHRRRVVRAVDSVSLSIHRGETLGLVGESGSGKSTTGRLAIGLLTPDRGQVSFEGANLNFVRGLAWRRSRRDLQMIFQDPASALDARMTVGRQIREVLNVHRIGPAAERQQAVQKLLERVGFSHAAHVEERYPHELSGGQRQRVVIARALALGPKLIVCDEPVSALDVSVQAQVVNLLKDLQDELGVAYLFISHDLRIVRHISHRVAVMYLGRIVEQASRDDLFRTPLHPYTQALLASVPDLDAAVSRKGAEPLWNAALEGELPDPADPPSGCRFHTRCPCAMEICRRLDPNLVEVRPSHFAACHLTDPKAGAGRVS